MTIDSPLRRARPPVLAAIWASTLLLLWVDLGWLHTAAALALGLLATVSLLDARRETRLVAGLIAVLSIGLLWSGAAASEVLRGLDRALIFAGLLPTLAMTRAVARGLPAVRTSQERIAALPSRWAVVGLQFGAHAFGLVLNTGTFALMGAVVSDDTPDAERRAAALAALRGMNSVALYSPFFLGFAVAFTYLPAVPVWQVFTLGPVLAGIALVVGILMFVRPLSTEAVRAGLACLAPIAPTMATVAGLVVLASQVLPISTLGAVLVVMPALAAAHLLLRPHRIASVIDETRRAMSGMGDDMAIVSAALILGTLAESAPPVRDLLAPWLAANLPAGAAIAATVAVMIGFAIVGLHPMITGTVMMAAFAGSGLPIADLPLMMAMLVGWGFGSMISISSLSVVTAGQMFRVRPVTLAFGPNVAFVAVFACLAVAVLTGLNAVMVTPY